MLAVTSFAQESRQDASISFVGTYQPTVTGNSVTQTSTLGEGALVSYRFMLTPSSAIEGNYQYSRFDMKYNVDTNNYTKARFHTFMQEATAAYVRSFVYKKYNPFAEAGIGLLLFAPIDDTGTTTNAGTRTRALSGLFGGGIAYELSPSWDLRVEYRAFLLKSIDFGIPQFKTNRFYLIQQPAIGIAYHF